MIAPNIHQATELRYTLHNTLQDREKQLEYVYRDLPSDFKLMIQCNPGWT
jgi:hypothetical protein